MLNYSWKKRDILCNGIFLLWRGDGGLDGGGSGRRVGVETLRCGIKLIDQQHRELVNFFLEKWKKEKWATENRTGYGIYLHKHANTNTKNTHGIHTSASTQANRLELITAELLPQKRQWTQSHPTRTYKHTHNKYIQLITSSTHTLSN